MKSVVEPLEGNKVKVSVEVDEQEFDRAVDAAFRKIAREVRIPGFRPGRAPRRILEARLGKEAGRTEALRDSLPEFYAQAVRENQVDAIAPPEIDITGGEDDGLVSFDAVVEVRPILELVGYDALRVEIPSPEVTDEDIQAQIDRLRANSGELVPVTRAIRTGDQVTIDLAGSRDGEPQPGLSTEDFLYEVGSASVVAELDTALEGATVDEPVSFDAELPDGPVSFTVAIKEVKEQVLPEVTDEWASEASEFDTADELRADITTRMSMVKRVQASMAARNGAVDALLALVSEDPPAPMIDAEVERRAHDLGHRLEAQGATIADYLQATGQSEEQVVAELRAAAVPSVKADLALRAVARAEKLAPTDEEMDAELARLAGAYNLAPDEFRRQVESAGQILAVRSDFEKQKALNWLVEHVEVVDTEGRPVDRALLEPPVSEDEVGDTEPDAGAPDAEAADAEAAESGEA